MSYQVHLLERNPSSLKWFYHEFGNLINLGSLVLFPYPHFEDFALATLGIS